MMSPFGTWGARSAKGLASIDIAPGPDLATLAAPHDPPDALRARSTNVMSPPAKI